jgi:pimeloyl-ACP methyl ester carboxylesterase
MVMHGMSRNADDYRDQWHELAIKHNFLLIVPEFSAEKFPGGRGYNLGNVYDYDDEKIDPSLWSFSAIEGIFSEAKHRFSMDAGNYALYGHSAGSQFVHRFLLHFPEARVSRVVLANAGWYTLPDFEVDYPYGLKDSAITQGSLESFLARDLTVLLGDQDNNPNEEGLRKTKEARKQGRHRLARGHNFFATGKITATKQNLPIGWRIAVVHGVAHDNSKMAPAAIQFLLD